MWSVWLVFCDHGFHSVCPLMDKYKRLVEASWWERNLGLVLMGGAMLSKSLIQFSIDGWGSVPSLLFGLRPNHGRGNNSKGDLLQKDFIRTVVFSAPDTSAGLCRRLLDTHRQVWLSLLWVHCTFLLAPGTHKVLSVPSKSLFPQSCGSSIIKSHWPPKSNFLGILSPFARSPGWKVCCGS